MPWAVQSPATSQHMPVGIHGDAARLWTVSKFEKLVGVSMNLPLFRPRTARFSRFLLFVCPSEKLWKNRTLNEVFKRLTWSFNAAFDGKNPSVGCPGYELSKKDKDRAGLPLTHAHRKFTLCELRGDWEWNRDVWRPKAAWNARQVCMFCPAVSRGDPRYLYHNCGASPEDDCAWIREEYSLHGFISQRLKDQNLCNST